MVLRVGQVCRTLAILRGLDGIAHADRVEVFIPEHHRSRWVRLPPWRRVSSTNPAWSVTSLAGGARGEQARERLSRDRISLSGQARREP